MTGRFDLFKKSISVQPVENSEVEQGQYAPPPGDNSMPFLAMTLFALLFAVMDFVSRAFDTGYAWLIWAMAIGGLVLFVTKSSYPAMIKAGGVVYLIVIGLILSTLVSFFGMYILDNLSAWLM